MKIFKPIKNTKKTKELTLKYTERFLAKEWGTTLSYLAAIKTLTTLTLQK